LKVDKEKHCNSEGIGTNRIRYLAKTLITIRAVHRPPLAVLTPRAARARAIP
jgi:hypothetical protein